MRFQRALATIGLAAIAALASASALANPEASKKCLKCHEAQAESMNRSAHAVAADPRTPSCVSCHGPSETHAAKMGQVPPDRKFKGDDSAASAEQSQVCQGCHEKGVKQAMWASSAHPAAGVSCSGCHKVHTNADKVLSRATQAEACVSCHKTQRTQMHLPSRHPVAEGKMSCSSCHNVHGSAGPALVRRSTVNDTCYTCHAEKRGPFVHQHEPVTEDCGICHNPHGSTVNAMLKVRAPILCNQCHTPHSAGEVGALGGQPGVFTPPGSANIGPTTNGKNVVNMWQGRSCMNCHTQVHGSNNASTTNPTPKFMFR